MSEKQTAKEAIRILCCANIGFKELSASEKTKLSTVFARRNQVLYGKAFDLVNCKTEVDFLSEDIINSNLESIKVYEIKSTNRKNVPVDFAGYFFDLTTAELLVAQSLGNQYKFAFVNTVRGNYLEMTLQELFARARKIYPKWAVLL
ncbi:MAG: hypothetical protein LYZ69_07630 [Nitrososphaerales archaeon]|nr:hypothetical protein [Nitrososphaerales archaeon]